MPTPFYHLRLAQELLADPHCPQLLHQYSGEFYLGNIAPDAQNISGQTRESTHFFEVPLRDKTPAWEVMFAQYPSIADVTQLPLAHAAFLAGYICHLAVDQRWIISIFDPIFGEESEWQTKSERFFIHNVLRIHLDDLDHPILTSNSVGASLQKAQPQAWLPFLSDIALVQWRNFVAKQLTGNSTQTIEVFAKRMKRPMSDFESLLQSADSMERQVFNRVPHSLLTQFRDEAWQESCTLITQYLSNR